MRSKIIEVSSGLSDGNWGRFLLQQYEPAERHHESRYAPPGEPYSIWPQNQPPPESVLWILDLVTGEGATFDLSLEAPLGAQLERHQVWVCVLYEPFLLWLQDFVRRYHAEHERYDGLLSALPPNVNLSAPQELIGFRRGDWLADLPREALAFLQHPLVGGSLPLSLRRLLKKLLPNTRTR